MTKSHLFKTKEQAAMLNHLPDVRKMVSDVLSCILTGFCGFVNYFGKILPFAVSK